MSTYTPSVSRCLHFFFFKQCFFGCLHYGSRIVPRSRMPLTFARHTTCVDGDKLGVISARRLQRMIGWYGGVCFAVYSVRLFGAYEVLCRLIFSFAFASLSGNICFNLVHVFFVVRVNESKKRRYFRTAYSLFFCLPPRRRGSSSPCCANLFRQEPDLKRFRYVLRNVALNIRENLRTKPRMTPEKNER